MQMKTSDQKRQLGLRVEKDTSTLPKRRFVQQIPHFNLQHVVENWSGKHIARWIEGLGDAMNPFLGYIRDNIHNGKQLSAIDDDSLQNFGVTGVGARRTILQAIQLLQYFCYEAPNENLQRLAMSASLTCKSLSRELRDALRLKEQAMRRSEFVAILNKITISLSLLTENVKKLIFWLDRSPFDDMEQFVEIRNKICALIFDIVKVANVQPKQLFSVLSDIIQKSDELRSVLEKVYRESDEPSILYTAYVERAVLRRHDLNMNWGINLQSSFRGVHVVSEVKVGSPADLCGKIDAGDEILLINGKTVIGWDLTRVARKLGSANDVELEIIVNKRPRQDVTMLLKSNPKTNRPLAKMAPGSKATNTAESNEQTLLMGSEYPLDRRRSTSFLNDVAKMNVEPSLPKRRASISFGSPRCAAPFVVGTEDDQWNWLELLEVGNSESAPRVVRRARTMRHQPDGYVRSFIDNRLVHDIEEDVVSDQLPLNESCPSEFASVVVVEPEELQNEKIREPSISDPEWSAPFQETTKQRFRSIGDSNISNYCLDSPMADEMSWSCGGVLPSPSTSSLHSIASPALMSTSAIEFDDETSPMLLANNERAFEGWIRRRKTASELSVREHTNKWPKCWAALRGPFLFIYANQFTKKADLTINVARCRVSDETQLKTSKKNVFRLWRDNPRTEQHFSCYSQIDMKRWMEKLEFAGEFYAQRTMSKSVSYFKENTTESLNSSQSYYNTVTSICSLISGEREPETSSASTAAGSNTLPRPTLLSGKANK